MAAPADIVEIGAVARAHGVRGELRIHLHNPASEALERVQSVTIGSASFTIESMRQTNNAVLVRLRGVDDRDAAERLKGQRVSVTRDSLGFDDGDVLLADLVGLRAVLSDGSDWGEIVRVETGPQDRLVIRATDGGGERERQLPLVDRFVISVDLDAGTVTVDPPEDLPEDQTGGRETSGPEGENEG